MPRTTFELDFRIANPADAPFIAELSRHAFGLYARQPERTTLQMTREKGSHTELLFYRNQPAGFAVVQHEPLGRPFGPWSAPVVARLNAIAVVPALRGRRLGMELLRRCETVASDAGAVTMSLMTAESNAAARHLFLREGYVSILSLGPVYRQGRRAIAMMKSLAL